MNRKSAKEIVETITNEQLAQMFENAQNNVPDWTVVSIVNRSFTKGVAWNILANGFDVKHIYNGVAKVNMIREFGDYLPEDLKPLPKPKKVVIVPTHHDPIFFTKK